MQRPRGAFARSRSIDHQLDEDRERRRAEIQLLILGGASSGKSTFIKQLRICHGDGFPVQERAKLRSHVFENVTDGFNGILDNMAILGVEVEVPENRTFAKELQQRFPRINQYKVSTPCSIPCSTGGTPAAASPACLPSTDVCTALPRPSSPRLRQPRPDYGQVADYTSQILALWSDPGVQKAYARRGEFRYLLFSAEDYYLRQLAVLLRDDYTPSLQDVLYIRKPTLGVQEHTFTFNGLNYRVIDVAGQKSQRKKWIHFFEGVTAVIFFAALSGYCETLEEDRSTNSLHDSMAIFKEVTQNEFLKNTDIIMFLNKKDEFEEKIKSTNLSVCFPEYKGENTIESCLCHIREKFSKQCKPQQQLHCHVSCAVDTGLMRRLIDSVMQVIVEINMRKASKPL